LSKEHSFSGREYFFHWFHRRLNRTELEIHASFVHFHLLLIADSKIFIEQPISQSHQHKTELSRLDRIFPVSYGREYVIGSGSQDVDIPYLFFPHPLPGDEDGLAIEFRWLNISSRMEF
jgi:hypothetical protein